MTSSLCGTTTVFQLTRPRGTRRVHQSENRVADEFQLTRPRGTRRPFMRQSVAKHQFQLTRPRGTRPGKAQGCPDEKCFNSRVRGGRDSRSNPGSRPFSVSTHASAGDATERAERILSRLTVSTHASAGDATRLSGPTARRTCFNSRVRGGRDSLCVITTSGAACFNSRVRGGRDPHRVCYVLRVTMFQLTRPRGTRLVEPYEPAARQRFNSRVRGGRDVEARAGDAVRRVSTHASAGDATCGEPVFA